VRTSEEILDYVERLERGMKQKKDAVSSDNLILQAIFDMVIANNQRLLDFIGSDRENDCIAESSNL